MPFPFQVVLVEAADQIDVLVEQDYTGLKRILETNVNFTLYVSGLDTESKREKKMKKQKNRKNQQG